MKKLIIFFIAIGLFGFTSNSLCQESANQTPTAPRGSGQEPVLTNADIVKLCKIGLGDEVVIAKINSAKLVNFDTSTDALIKLKDDGVSSNVIAAMLNHITADAQRTAPVAQTESVEDRTTKMLHLPSNVNLSLQSGDVPLKKLTGNLNSAGFMAFRTTFYSYPGSRSETRTNQKRPSLQYSYDSSPVGRVFLVKLDSNKESDDRDLKLTGRSRFSTKGQFDPDEDLIILFDVAEISAGHWRITPKKDLDPGEYGLFVNGGKGIPALWGFGIDPI